MTEYKIDTPTWAALAWADIHAGRPFTIVATGPEVKEVLETMRARIADVVASPFGKEAAAALTAAVPQAGGVLGQATLIAGVCAAGGAVGGIVGVVAFIAGLAHFAGYTTDFILRVPPGLTDPLKAELRVALSKV